MSQKPIDAGKIDASQIRTTTLEAQLIGMQMKKFRVRYRQTLTKTFVTEVEAPNRVTAMVELSSLLVTDGVSILGEPENIVEEHTYFVSCEEEK